MRLIKSENSVDFESTEKLSNFYSPFTLFYQFTCPPLPFKHRLKFPIDQTPLADK